MAAQAGLRPITVALAQVVGAAAVEAAQEALQMVGRVAQALNGVVLGLVVAVVVERGK